MGYANRQGLVRFLLAIAVTACLLALGCLPSQAAGTVTNPSFTSLVAALASGGTVSLQFDGTIVASNTITILSNTVLYAPDGFQVTLEGATATRVFSVAPGVPFVLSNVTIAGGTGQGAAGYSGGPSGGGGGNGADGQGGAVFNQGSSSFYNCTFLSNIAIGGSGGYGSTNPLDNSGFGGAGGNAGGGFGGAIYNASSLYLSNCVFFGNSAMGGDGGTGGTGSSGPGSGGVGGAAFGGALYNPPGATATIISCGFTNNSAAGASNQPVGVAFSGNTGVAGTTGGLAEGGAICNLGTNTVIGCAFLANTATGGVGSTGGSNAWAGGIGGAGGSAWGAGAFNGGWFTISNTTFAGGTAVGAVGSLGGAGPGFGPGYGGSGGQGAGGGVYTSAGAVTLAGDSTFSGNSVTAGNSGNVAPFGNNNGNQGSTGGLAIGGGLCNFGTGGLGNCTLYGNLATAGMGGKGCTNGYRGGLGGSGGNAAGGSLYNNGLLGVSNCTFASSTSVGGPPGLSGSGPVGSYPYPAGSPGASLGANIANDTGGSLSLKDTILAYPVNAANAYGLMSDAGFNLSSDATPAFGSTSTNGLDPILGPLAANGGPTSTLALLPGSPAINAGDPAFTPPPATDQRGLSRVVGGRVDIGAYEFQGPSAPEITALLLLPGGEIELQILAEQGLTYSVWFTTNIAVKPSSWVRAGSATAATNAGFDYTFTDTNAPGSAHRFYQVEWP